MKEIIVVGLDLRNRNEHMAIDEQIDLLVKAVHSAYSKAKAMNPNCHVIVAWNEFGIVDKEISKVIDYKIKNQFKEKLKAVTNQYEDLTIIAGTILSGKNKKAFESWPKKVKKMSQAYEAMQKDNQFNVGTVSRKIQLQELQRNKDSDSLTVVKNTCYIFSKNLVTDKERFDKGYAKRIKLVPIDKYDVTTANYIYEVEDNFKIIKIKDGEDSVSIGVEICAEQGLLDEYVSKEYEKTKKLNYPELRFVISNTTDLESDIRSTSTVYLDARQEFLFNKSAKSDRDIKFLSMDITHLNSKPLQFFSFQSAQKDFVNYVTHIEFLLDKNKSEINANDYKEMKEMISRVQKNLTSSQKEEEPLKRYNDIILDFNSFTTFLSNKVDALRNENKKTGFLGLLVNTTKNKNLIDLLEGVINRKPVTQDAPKKKM